MIASRQMADTPYAGRIEVGMVFDFAPGQRHKYERLTITKVEGAHIWARGRSGETYYEESDFRRAVAFVAAAAPAKQRPTPLLLERRYEGTIAPGMVFDFEPGKKHQYERLTITKVEGPHIWARGRSGETYYDAADFRDHVVTVEAARR